MISKHVFVIIMFGTFSGKNLQPMKVICEVPTSSECFIYSPQDNHCSNYTTETLVSSNIQKVQYKTGRNHIFSTLLQELYGCGMIFIQ